MAKAAPKLSIRNFIPVTTSGMDKKDPAMSMTLAVNRLGHTVTDVGKILTAGHQARLDAAYAVQGRKSLAQDRARENKIEKQATDEIEKEANSRGYSKRGGSGLFGFLGPLIEPLIAFATTLGTYFALDWLSKKENKEAVRTGFEWIGKWLGTVWKVGAWGFRTLYDGLFDPDGNDSYLMRALKVVGGLAALKLASRILMPWKLAGDIGKLSKLFKVNRTTAAKNAKKVNQNNFLKNNTRPKRPPRGVRSGNASKAARQRYARRFGGNASKSRFGGRIAGRAGFKGMTGMGRFMRSGVGGGIFAGALSFGSRLAAGDSMNVAAGGGIGATIGTVAVTALLTPVLGPFAPIVGGVLGGFFGDKIGAFLGEAIEPILKPLGDFFKNIALPMFNAFVKPVATAIQDLFEPLKHVLDMVLEFIAPIAGAAFQGLMDYIIGPAAKRALDSIVWIFEKAIWAINNIGSFVSGTGNTITRLIGSDGQKAQAQLENENYDVKRLKKELADLKAQSANGEGDKRTVWPMVDGTFITSNGAPGMHAFNGYGVSSTIDEKIKHWEEVLIPFAEKKAASSKAALAQFEMAQPQTDMVSDPGAIPDGGNDGTGDMRIAKLNSGKVQGALTKTVGFGKGTVNRCADSVRQYLKAVGHPQWATVATKTGNLDPDGTAHIGPRMAASFAGTDVGKHIMNKSQLKPGDILLYRDTMPGKFTPGAVTHVGVYAGNGDQYDHNDRKGFHKRSLSGVLNWAKWGGGIRLKGMPSAGLIEEGEKTKVSTSSNLNNRTTQLTTASQQQDTELSSADGSSMVVFQPIIKPVVSETGVTGAQTVTSPSDYSLTGMGGFHGL